MDGRTKLNFLTNYWSERKRSLVAQKEELIKTSRVYVHAVPILLPAPLQQSKQIC